MAKNLKLNEVNLNNLHLLAVPAQIGVACLVAVVILIAAYLALYRGQLTELGSLEENEVKLKDEYTQKSVQAANLDVLREELVQIRSAFNILLKQLPTDAEIPNLIQELHQAGATNGMRMNSVKPQPAITDADGQIKKLPYQISISGNYNQLSQFARDVGQLSRIITLSNLKLKNDDKNSTLTLDALANTYQAMPLSETAASEPAAQAASAPAANPKPQ